MSQTKVASPTIGCYVGIGLSQILGQGTYIWLKWNFGDFEHLMYRISWIKPDLVTGHPRWLNWPGWDKIPIFYPNICFEGSSNASLRIVKDLSTFHSVVGGFCDENLGHNFGPSGDYVSTLGQNQGQFSSKSQNWSQFDQWGCRVTRSRTSSP